MTLQLTIELKRSGTMARQIFLIIAGALLISPLVAFRSPISHSMPSLTRRYSVVSREDERIFVAESHNYVDTNLKSSSAAIKPKPAIDGNSNPTGKRRNADSALVRKRTITLLNITSDGFPIEPKRRGLLKTDKKTFDWLIGTWAYSKQSDSADMATKLLQRMGELQSQGNAKLAPDSKTYTNAIKVIAFSGQSDAGFRAEKLLNEMIYKNLSPNTMTYTYVIDAHSRSSSQEAPHHAQRLVEAMETARLQGQNVKPTARAWNSVIKAWSAVSASKASACLDAMEKLADETGNDEVRPNSYNVNSVINAWAKSGNAGNAEKILQKMERMYRDTGDERFRPRTETYNAIIDSYSKSGEADAPHRAELLLSYMMELYETGHNEAVKPNVRSFNSMMNVIAKSGDLYAPERAADILKKMEELTGSELQVAPDATSFATAINAYARSLNYGKADAAYKLFQKMDRLYDLTGNEALRPNAIVINSVLNACAFTIGDLEEQRRAIEIANLMFTAICRSDDEDPDEVTYGSYLKVICNQMPPGKQRNKVVHAIFQKAVSAGLVGHLVLKQIKEVGLDDATQKMYFGTQSLDHVSLKDLPSSWTNNVAARHEIRL
ncbi:hypothetical protein ACHAWO_007863 [Cyclotella atomus]|uniref:Pentacotripeptide-repeat region of PRORP domain-containing protein n=1 Tax=Cyclotella atomus TaxID=382360 RepID=A0ABD3NUB8_9STRA